MKKFAVMSDDNIVENVIIGNSLEEVSLLLGKTCIEYGDEDIVGIDYTYADGVFTAPKPYPSWVLENNKWIPPVACPKAPEGSTISYKWDEDSLSWIDVIIEQEVL